MFCKYCGRPLGKSSYCSHCKKENVLFAASNDLEKWLQQSSGEQPPQPPEAIRQRYYQNGLREGFENGRKEGYKDAVSNIRRKGKRIILFAAAATLFCLICSAALFRYFGYRSGFSAGKEDRQTLEQEYQRGYLQGQTDALSALPAVSVQIGPTLAPEPVLQIYAQMGDAGEKVKILQSMLCQIGWDINVDGNFGSETEKAVKEFQQQNNLPQTGEVDWLTWQRMSDYVFLEKANAPTPENPDVSEAPPSSEKYLENQSDYVPSNKTVGPRPSPSRFPAPSDFPINPDTL